MKIILTDRRPGKPTPDKEITGQTEIPLCGDRIRFGNQNPWPKVMYRHFDYDNDSVYLVMQ